MADLSWLTAAILGLAAYRLTLLVTSDVITEGLRRRIWARWPADDTIFPDDGTITQDDDDKAYGTTTRGIDVFWSDEDRAWLAVTPTRIGYLVGCSDCAGVWVSLVVVGAWLVWPPVLVAWGVLAVAGVVSLLARWI